VLLFGAYLPSAGGGAEFLAATKQQHQQQQTETCWSELCGQQADHVAKIPCRRLKDVGTVHHAPSMQAACSNCHWCQLPPYKQFSRPHAITPQARDQVLAPATSWPPEHVLSRPHTITPHTRDQVLAPATCSGVQRTPHGPQTPKHMHANNTGAEHCCCQASSFPDLTPSPLT
jgi:hypothetical protein